MYFICCQSQCGKYHGETIAASDTLLKRNPVEKKEIIQMCNGTEMGIVSHHLIMIFGRNTRTNTNTGEKEIERRNRQRDEKKRKSKLSNQWYTADELIDFIISLFPYKL